MDLEERRTQILRTQGAGADLFRGADLRLRRSYPVDRAASWWPGPPVPPVPLPSDRPCRISLVDLITRPGRIRSGDALSNTTATMSSTTMLDQDRR